MSHTEQLVEDFPDVCNRSFGRYVSCYTAVPSSGDRPLSCGVWRGAECIFGMHLVAFRPAPPAAKFFFITDMLNWILHEFSHAGRKEGPGRRGGIEIDLLLSNCRFTGSQSPWHTECMQIGLALEKSPICRSSGLFSIGPSLIVSDLQSALWHCARHVLGAGAMASS